MVIFSSSPTKLREGECFQLCLSVSLSVQHGEGVSLSSPFYTRPQPQPHLYRALAPLCTGRLNLDHVQTCSIWMSLYTPCNVFIMKHRLSESTRHAVHSNTSYFMLCMQIKFICKVSVRFICHESEVEW